DYYCQVWDSTSDLF
nr:immunoglobulin light chain junction region [Macaca mulatta]